MKLEVSIGGRQIGPDHPPYVVAELSANHNQNFERAVELVRAAKNAGADAIKLQTYTADTLTIKSDRPEFRIAGGTIWDGRTLHDLYSEAYTPWEWQPRLKAVADDLGIPLFSTPFDSTAVDFLEQMDVPAHKVASFELVDLPLIRKIAQTGKPLVISTGMASIAEISEAVDAARSAGATEIVLLKCTSAYPAPAEEAHLRTIPHLSAAFGVPAGLSDHTLGIAVPVAAAAVGASFIEKHFTLSRGDAGPDSAFSLEPAEFRAMADAVRTAWSALGHVHYGTSARDVNSLRFRRSLFVVRDIPAGGRFTKENVRSIRPSNGLPPKFLEFVLERHAVRPLAAGTPLDWSMIAGDSA